jgi:membrane protease YdiL (CAAX protease family)
MPSRRLAAALALTGIVTLAAAHACSRSVGEGPRALALVGLGLELFLALVAVAGGLLTRRPLVVALGLEPGGLPWSRLALLVVGTLGLSQGLDGVLELTGWHERSALADFERSLAGAGGVDLALTLGAIGLAPGIAEELLCRGLVQRGVERRLGTAPAVIVAALLFGILHLDPVHAAFAALLGLYLGMVAALSRSTRAAILCHATNNLVAVTLAARLPEAQLPGTGAAVAGFALAAACLWAARRGPACGTHTGPPESPSGDPGYR